MKSAVETLSPTRVKLTVEVPFDELRPSLDAAYKKIGLQVRVQGFRPGRVPPRVLDQRVGRGVVLEEAVQEAIPRFYGDAVKANEISVLGHPAVDVTDFADGGQLVFTAEVDVLPTVELPAYDGIAVTVDDVEVVDSEVEEQIATLRDRFAVLQVVDRAAEAGDYVSIDIAATVDGEPVPGAETAGLSYEVGSGSMLPGLDEALPGLAEGGSRTFETDLVAGEYAGRAAQVEVTVRSVKAKDLPELDDEFAQTASEFDTLEELRADYRTRFERVKRLQQGVQARDKVLEALLAAVDVPLPASAVEDEAHWRRHNMQEQLEQAGLTWEGYVESSGQSEEEFEAELAASAAEAVKSQLLLDAVADKEELGITEAELSELVVRRAQRAGVAPDDYARRVVEAGQLGALVSEVRRGKALATVLEAAIVTDASGRPVDLAALRSADEPGGGSGDETADETDAETGAGTGAEGGGESGVDAAAEAQPPA
ncbi:MAG: trigger factor [Actinomycetota bacterium]|nr:trigger factor [Actinomycetota bacterium]